MTNFITISVITYNYIISIDIKNNIFCYVLKEDYCIGNKFIE